jgi:hypothetical protein
MLFGLPAHIIQIRVAGVMIGIEPKCAQSGGYACASPSRLDHAP